MSYLHVPCDDKNIPEELWDAELDIEYSDYQPAERGNGIPNGYYESIWLSTDDEDFKPFLTDDVIEYLVDIFDEKIQDIISGE